MTNIIEITILLILLVVVAITAASEISLVAVSRLRLRRLSSEGSKTAMLIMKILKMPAKFFGTILVSNNIVGALIAVIVTANLIRLAGEGQWVMFLATAISAGLIIIVEVTAKTVAARDPEKIAWIMARPTRHLMTVSAPIVRIFELVTEFIIRIVGGKAEGRQSLVTEEEIRALIKIGEEEGVLHKEKFRMLTRVFDFGKTIVRSVMTPRSNVFSVSVDSKIDDILDK
ncbi:MAG: CNNM domain-containing protein, partial [Candidatus Omnitrophota bacterium]